MLLSNSRTNNWLVFFLVFVVGPAVLLFVGQSWWKRIKDQAKKWKKANPGVIRRIVGFVFQDRNVLETHGLPLMIGNFCVPEEPVNLSVIERNFSLFSFPLWWSLSSSQIRLFVSSFLFTRMSWSLSLGIGLVFALVLSALSLWNWGRKCEMDSAEVDQERSSSPLLCQSSVPYIEKGVIYQTDIIQVQEFEFFGPIFPSIVFPPINSVFILPTSKVQKLT